MSSCNCYIINVLAHTLSYLRPDAQFRGPFTMPYALLSMSLWILNESPNSWVMLCLVAYMPRPNCACSLSVDTVMIEQFRTGISDSGLAPPPSIIYQSNTHKNWLNELKMNCFWPRKWYVWEFCSFGVTGSHGCPKFPSEFVQSWLYMTDRYCGGRIPELS